MCAPCIAIAGGMLQHGMQYCYAKPIVQSRRILHRAADIVLPRFLGMIVRGRWFPVARMGCAA